MKQVKTKQKQQSNKLGYPCMVFWVSMVHQEWIVIGDGEDGYGS
jgi:hypothetical protein